MSQSKCALLKPVDKLTGNFFLFSQYAQDLTEQYSNPDSHRCVPSKYIALNLNYGALPSTTDEELSKNLAEIFQNYFENSCAFLRSQLGSSWDSEYSTALLFQALEKFSLIDTNNLRAPHIDDNTDTNTGEVSGFSSAVTGISDAIQYIGDINIYSYDDHVDGIGYNEIYCYIPNEAKCTDYELSTIPMGPSRVYDGDTICGYAGQEPYNGLSWNLYNEQGMYFYDSDVLGQKCYGVGSYGNPTGSYVLIPQCLQRNTESNDQPRIDPATGKQLDKFDVNAIIVLYDVVCKTELDETVTLKQNLPLGIYFTGKLENDGTNINMTNKITKYVNSGQIYNQGTSYGLRICTRFLTSPNSTEVAEQTVNGSSNVSEMAPVLEKMGETIAAAGKILTNKDELYEMLKDHLAQFKDNKVNVPYVRQLGNKKYWFVNGKNTGAIAQYEFSDQTDLVETIFNMVMREVYTKEEIRAIIGDYITRNEFESRISLYAKKDYVDSQIENLKKELLVYLQSE